MKLFGIILMVCSVAGGVINYSGSLKSRLRHLKEWEEILHFWQEQIAEYAYSLNDLIRNLELEERFAGFETCKWMVGKEMPDIIAELQSPEYDLSPEDKEIILRVLNNLGNSLKDSQITHMNSALQKLGARIQESERKVKEQLNLAYKLAPLICGMVAVLLW